MELTGRKILSAFLSKREKTLEILLKSNQDPLCFLEILKLQPPRNNYLQVNDPDIVYVN